jgi:dolichol-phosphate mannosyltransferase
MTAIPHTLKLSVVIPAYNEEQNIRATVEEIQPTLREEGIPYELILVNDCSRDKTPEVIAEMMREDPAIVTVDRTPPGGFGRAVRSGLEVLTGDVVAIYMADQSDDPADLVACYRKIEQGYDCVFGSRFIRGAKVTKYPPFKLVANRIVNTMIQWMFWCHFNDLTNAFKVYRTEVIRECGPFRASHFNITIEMSLSVLIRRYNIAQIPISWRGRTWGSSNLRISEMGRRYLNVLLKIFFERVLIEDDIMEERLSHRAREAARVKNMLDRIDDLEQRVAALEVTDEEKVPRE